MPGQTRLRSAPAGILLLAMMAAAIMFTAAPPISGGEPRDTVITPTITISATGGVTPGARVTVTEGTPASFTITADTAPAAPLEVQVAILTIGNFTNIPSTTIEGGPDSGYEVRVVTIAAGTTQAVLVIMTEDDMVEEEDGSVDASLESRPNYTVGNPSRGSLQVKDNDIVAPSKMDLPTLLPADGRLEVFWEEPPHTRGRKIDSYRISWASPTHSATSSRSGDQRHASFITHVNNGETQTIRIQACKGSAYCSEKSDAVRATPTDSGPTMTGPTTKTLPEESTGTVGQFTAVPSTPGPITWRLGGSSEYFTATVNPDGTMTLTMNEGVSFEDLQRSQHMLRVLVVATDSTTDQATSVIPVTVTITDVDETPVFAESLIVKPAYVVGQRIDGFVLPLPKADETPVTYSMLTVDPVTGLDLAAERKLPPGISLSQGRVIDGIPTQAGTFTATYAATDVDGDVGTLEIQFTVVDAHTPTVAIQIDNQLMSQTDSSRDIELDGHFEDPDGDDLTYTAPSDNIGVVTTGISGSVLTLTPVAEGTATITVTATDPAGLLVFQEFTVTVEDQSLTFGGMTFVPPVLYLDAQAIVKLPEATGGSGTLNYSVTDQPDVMEFDMEFDVAKRELSGTPSVAGTFSITYTAKDENDAVATLIIEIEVKAKMLPATGLDVKPAAGMIAPSADRETALRYALLTWEESKSVHSIADYKIYAKYPGGPATGTLVDTVQATKFLFPLDHPSKSEGTLLAEESLSVWIVAEETRRKKESSVASETIVIEDTPIISIDGDSRALLMGRDIIPGIPDTPGGRATVKWMEQPNVTSYTIRWKELGDDRFTTPHTDPEWILDSTSVPTDFSGTETIISSSQTTYEIQNLDLDKLYAVQLNHTRSTSTGQERVFAARDFHVYPSARAAGGGERIASAPLRRQLLGKEYQYAVCVGTFPGDPVRWRAYIEHALEQWEIATDGLVKMTPALDDLGNPQQCADYGEYVQDITNAVALYVVDMDATEEEITARIKIEVDSLMERFRDAGIVTKAQALDPGVSEVLMFSDPMVGGTILNDAFLEIADAVGRKPCAEPNAEVAACALSSNEFGDDKKVSVDLLFSRKFFLSTAPDLTEDHFPGGDRTPERGDIRFNSCEGTHPIYASLVHEAGHALGIGGGTDGSERVRHHFNDLIPEATLSYGAKHDCFPHPLDIAVIYAMYQTQ